MLSKYPNKTLKLGAIVSLSPNHAWRRLSSNPVGVRGVIDHLANEWGGIGVAWDNGTHNTYRPNDYDLIAEGEPGFLSV